MVQAATTSLVGLIPLAVSAGVVLTASERTLQNRTLQGNPPKRKISKSRAKYIIKSKVRGQTCSDCEFFNGEDSCDIVAGLIAPGGWSKFYLKGR